MKLLKLNIQRFAASAEVSASIISQSIENNTSVVRITYKVKRTSGSTYWSDAKKITFTCDGQTQTGTFSFPSSVTSKSTSKDFTVSHKSDGTKSISFSVKVDVSVSLSPNPVSGSKTLTTIPRASAIDSASNVTLDSNCNVKWTPKDKTFKYVLKFLLGTSAIGTAFITPNQTTQYTYTGTNLSLKIFGDQIPNSKTASMTVELYTYNSAGTPIGDKSTKTITVTVPNNSSTQPTINISKVEENNQAVKNTGWGVYVQNKSQLNITYTTATKYSASIKETSFTIGGTAFTNNGTLTKSGSLVGTTKDSRGYTGTHTFGQINVVDYTAPKINTALCNRCRQDGTDDDNGEYLKYTFKASVSPVDNKNDKVFKIYYKEKTSSTYEYVDITPNTTDGYGVNYSNVVLSGKTFSSDVAYDIKFSANDTFGIETKVDAEIETGADLINFNKNGKAIAFGKVSEAGENEELMEIAMPVYADEIYQSAFPKYLPSGDMLSKDFWNTIPAGTYFYSKDEHLCTNTPANWGWIVKLGSVNNNVGKDFNVMFYQAATGNIWRLSANKSTATLNWKQLAYIEEYSYNTQVVGTYINGKPIYKRTYTGTTPTSSSNKTLESNVDQIVDFCMIVNRSNGQKHPINSSMINNDSNHASPLYVNGTNLMLYITNSNYLGQSYSGWVKFTKSTD